MDMTSSRENIQNILKPQKICTASCGHWIDTIIFEPLFVKIAQQPRFIKILISGLFPATAVSSGVTSADNYM